MYKIFFKRVFDFFISFFLLIVLSPVIVVIMFIQVYAYRGQFLFFQERPGKHENLFRVIKFKTMNDKKGEDGNLLPNNLRITKSGAFLRKTSLDEIPQLINVLKGEMSLVGPRPLLFKYIPLYSSEQQKRHLVRPGCYGMGTGKRQKCHQLDEEIRTRCLLCGECFLLAGSKNFIYDFF